MDLTGIELSIRDIAKLDLQHKYVDSMMEIIKTDYLKALASTDDDKLIRAKQDYNTAMEIARKLQILASQAAQTEAQKRELQVHYDS